MYNENQKPRLRNLLARLSFSKPDLELIKKLYIIWATYTEYLIFRKENIHTEVKQWKAVKAAKRGNEVYVYRVRRRLKKLSQLPKVEFFNFKDRSRHHKTRILFIGLTYRRERRLDLAWERIGDNFNRIISALKKKYGKMHILRTWEAQNDGYPHIHGIFYFEEHEFETFFYNGKWWVSERDDVLQYWPWGFGDVSAMYSLGGGVGYVARARAGLYRQSGN